MKLHEWESLLPQWLGKPELQWFQWTYALWQIIRCNPLALFALSYLPFCLCQMYKKKTVVVLGDTTDYLLPYPERETHLRNNAHRLENLEILWDRSSGGWFYVVKYSGHYYFTNQNSLCQLARCAEKHGDIKENVIFVERLLTVTGSWAVGMKISHTEAYEKVFTKRYHFSRGADVVLPTIFDYVDLSSKIWGVLSTIPILLQARNYNRFSNLFSLLVILLDYSRHTLYKFYDKIFMKITDFVKLNLFKERQGLYDFFSIFSKRWRYTDTVKRHAYVAQIDEKLKIRPYCKLEGVDDLQVERWDEYGGDPNDQNICMEIVDGRASVSLMQYFMPYADAILHKKVYVP
ncbi:hypothetical protein SUGI_0675200 [Cryptomeria japonica]|nr:hypothetical protein SUGI_0675200 [Cryptomeria japonica]